MEISTIHNVGDKVYFLMEKDGVMKIRNGVVKQISGQFKSVKDGDTICNELRNLKFTVVCDGCLNSFDVRSLYSSEEKLIESLKS